MRDPRDIASMADLRVEIDALDRQLMPLLGQRARLIARAAELKPAEGLPARTTDRVAEGLIVDSYYNLGVRDLQRGDPVSATEKFQEAIALDRGDPQLQRAARFAATGWRRLCHASR